LDRDNKKPRITNTQGHTHLDLIALIPEEDIWLASRHSRETRRAYKNDVCDFINTTKMRSRADLEGINHRAVVFWKRCMEERGLRPGTIRRKLSSLSSLFIHLIKHGVVTQNPVRDVERPPAAIREGRTACFSPGEARKILDFPPTNTIRGLRDRAILSVGLQVGARRSEIAALKVKDFHKNRGYWALHFIRKGRRDLDVSIHPQVAQRILEYMEVTHQGKDVDEPLFLPIGRSWKNPDMRRSLSPDTIDRILKKYAKRIGLERGFSAHSMRATFITTALENGASLEDVQRAVGHDDPSTTKLYDRRRINPERSASFYANY